jgi:GTPase SAR1 family protein
VNGVQFGFGSILVGPSFSLQSPSNKSAPSIKVNGEIMKTQVWVTPPPSQQQTAITSAGAYYRGALGAMLVYDISNRSSFQNVERWLKGLYY